MGMITSVKILNCLISGVFLKNKKNKNFYTKEISRER
nr:MAG TPA_asm: hypothetical protein [Caudoviricetes sp.]